MQTIERRVQPMRNRMTASVVMGLALAVLLLFSGTDVSAQIEKMSKEELKAMLGKPELVVIDVRQAGDLAKSNLKIKGAVREDPKREVKSWAGKYSKDKEIVLYCA
jgi:predicted sulfurtransferase